MTFSAVKLDLDHHVFFTITTYKQAALNEHVAVKTSRVVAAVGAEDVLDTVAEGRHSVTINTHTCA